MRATRMDRVLQTYYSVYPTRRNDHCIPHGQLDLDDLVHKVTQPCMVLDFRARPTLVGGEISGCGFDEVEHLGNQAGQEMHVAHGSESVLLNLG